VIFEGIGGTSSIYKMSWDFPKKLVFCEMDMLWKMTTVLIRALNTTELLLNSTRE